MTNNHTGCWTKSYSSDHLKEVLMKNVFGASLEFEY